MPNKSYLRKHYRSLRQNLPSEVRVSHTQNITDQIKDLDTKSDWKNITGFASQDGEPDLSDLLDYLKEKGTRVLLPRINNQNQMDFHTYEAKPELEPGPYGIRQPHRRSEKVPKEKIDCFLIPLVSFDDSGNRLGMGGGYYDKYFSTYISKIQSPLFGVAFSVQMSNKVLPIDDFDISLDGVITETGITSFTDIGQKYAS